VVCDGRFVSYGQLNDRANELAQQLRLAGIARGSIVGLLLRRSTDLVAGILAVLKAGAAYLPLEIHSPPKRLDYMLRQSGAALVLCDGREHLTRLSGETPGLNILDRAPSENGSGSQLPQHAAEDLAYVIYTSGTTGNPKGVMIEHRSVVNVVDALAERIDYTPGKTMLSATSVSFDIFVAEALLPLARGMTVILATEREQRDPVLLREGLRSSRAQMFQATPSRLRLLLGDEEGLGCLRQLDEILVGGEPFPETLFQQVSTLGPKIHNLYGPTETTVYSLTKLLTAGERITIGTPVRNTSVYVVGPNCQPCEEGIEGELWIGGCGVARGYIGEPQLTADKFVTAPFPPYERVYRTGDLVKKLPSGELEFLGRIDRQRKLRGHRVELEEIESLLLVRPEIQAAVVEVLTGERTGQYLCAYLVLRSGGTFDVSAVREDLKAHLPDYMVPAFFVQVPELPLTTNGKIDFSALPKPVPDPTAGRIPPRNETDRRLAAIWSELLGLPAAVIGIDSSFFELGGDSLNAALLAGRIHREFGVRIPMAALFANATIRELAACVASSETAPLAIIARADQCDVYPLSSEQSRIFLLQTLCPETTAYNLPEVYRSEGTLDVQRIERVFAALIQRNESLRTSFLFRNGTPVQRLHTHVPFRVEVQETSEQRVPQMIAAFIRPFALDRVPLLRVSLLRTDGPWTYFMFDWHHVISDGFSRDVLLRDFREIYSGGSPSELRIQYKDYVTWQTRNSTSDQMLQQKRFWCNMFEQPSIRLALTTDYPRPEVRKFSGGTVAFEIQAEVVQRLRALARREDASLFMVLFAVVSAFVGRICKQEDVVIGTPIAGRNHPDLERVVGMFVNTFAIRTHPEENKPFRQHLREVRNTFLDAFENQNYQFDQLVQALRVKREPGRNPLFDVMFVLQDTETQPFVIPGVRLIPCAVESASSKMDLTVHMREHRGVLTCTLEYDDELFRPATIQLMSGRLLVFLESAVDDPNSRIAELNLCTEQERLLNRYSGAVFAFQTPIHTC